MSYDLFLHSSPAQADSAWFAQYFSGRPHYEVSESQAFYENSDTGVYFTFELLEPTDDEGGLAGIAFNLNYFRPHTFALEALPELEAFAAEFRPAVEDPQVEGMEEGTFSAEGFLSGWSAGNRFAVRAILSQQEDHEVFTKPADELERIWKWNYQRQHRQTQLEDSMFVPSISFLKVGAGVGSISVWPDAIPIALPQTDYVLIGRDELSSADLGPDDLDLTLVPWKEVDPLVSAAPSQSDPLRYYLLEYDFAPDAIVDFVTGLSRQTEPLKGVPADQVLDAELVAEARAS